MPDTTIANPVGFFNQPISIALLSVISGLLGVFLSYVVGRIQQYKIDQKKEREKLKDTLSNLLIIYSHIEKLGLLLRTSSPGNISNIYPKQFWILFLNQGGIDFKELLTTYNNALDELRPINPVLYFKLYGNLPGINIIINHFMAMGNERNELNATAYAASFDVLLPNIKKDLRESINEIIRLTDLKQSDRLEIKRILTDSTEEELKNKDAEVNNFMKEYFFAIYSKMQSDTGKTYDKTLFEKEYEEWIADDAKMQEIRKQILDYLFPPKVPFNLLYPTPSPPVSPFSWNSQ